jgi:hypothetical protein
MHVFKERVPIAGSQPGLFGVLLDDLGLFDQKFLVLRYGDKVGGKWVEEPREITEHTRCWLRTFKTPSIAKAHTSSTQALFGRSRASARSTATSMERQDRLTWPVWTFS